MQITLARVSVRPSESQNSQDKNRAFFEGIRDLPLPWGLHDRPIPSVSGFGGNVAADVKLTRFLSPAVTSAWINYRIRNQLRDRSIDDDYIALNVKPKKIDSRAFIYDIFPKYITAFNGYRAFCADYLLSELAEDVKFSPPASLTGKNKVEKANSRFAGGSVFPVTYFDRLLCKRAFSLTPEQVRSQLRGVVEDVLFINDGVYIIGSSENLNPDQSVAIQKKIRDAIIPNPHRKIGKWVRIGVRVRSHNSPTLADDNHGNTTTDG